MSGKIALAAIVLLHVLIETVNCGVLSDRVRMNVSRIVADYLLFIFWIVSGSSQFQQQSNRYKGETTILQCIHRLRKETFEWDCSTTATASNIRRWRQQRVGAFGVELGTSHRELDATDHERGKDVRGNSGSEPRNVFAEAQAFKPRLAICLLCSVDTAFNEPITLDRLIIFCQDSSQPSATRSSNDWMLKTTSATRIVQLSLASTSLRHKILNLLN